MRVNARCISGSRYFDYESINESGFLPPPRHHDRSNTKGPQIAQTAR